MSSYQPNQNSNLEPIEDQIWQDGFDFLHDSHDWDYGIDSSHQATLDDYNFDFILPNNDNESGDLAGL